MAWKETFEFWSAYSPNYLDNGFSRPSHLVDIGAKFQKNAHLLHVVSANCNQKSCFLSWSIPDLVHRGKPSLNEDAHDIICIVIYGRKQESAFGFGPSFN